MNTAVADSFHESHVQPAACCCDALAVALHNGTPQTTTWATQQKDGLGHQASGDFVFGEFSQKVFLSS